MKINFQNWAHHIFLNHSPSDGERMISYAQRGEKWAKENHEVGSHCVGLLDLSFLSGLIGDWFSSFQDPDNKVASFFGNTFNAISGTLFGKREEDMYGDGEQKGIYSVGLNAVMEGKITPEDLRDQKKILEKVPAMDDFLENAHFLNDRVINKFWKWTTKISQIQPTVFLMSPFFGRKWSDIIFSGFQTLSRGTWRLTYFLPGAFHNNFIETMWDLSRLKIKSMFNIGKAGSEFDTLKNKLGEMAHVYAEKVKTDESPSNIGNKTGLGAYLWMLKDRMKQHWRGIREPEKVLREKVTRGELAEISEAIREAEPSKTSEKGFVVPGSDTDKKAQRNASLVTFTAPACAAVGLLATFVFEPLKCVWDAAGLQKGRGLLGFLALSRGPASLVNYFFKFFVPEKDAASKYKKLEKDLNDGTANEAVKQLYQTRKGRLRNSYMGMSLLVASVFETCGQLFNSTISENRALKFLFTGLSRFVGVGFTRYFSARRRDLGHTALIHAAAERMLGKDSVTEDDIKSISKDRDPEFQEVIQSLGKSDEKEEATQSKKIYDPAFSWLSEQCVRLADALTG